MAITLYLCLSKSTSCDVPSHLNRQLNHNLVPVCYKCAMYQEWTNWLKPNMAYNCFLTSDEHGF